MNFSKCKKIQTSCSLSTVSAVYKWILFLWSFYCPVPFCTWTTLTSESERAISYCFVAGKQITSLAANGKKDIMVKRRQQELDLMLLWLYYFNIFVLIINQSIWNLWIWRLDRRLEVSTLYSIQQWICNITITEFPKGSI